MTEKRSGYEFSKKDRDAAMRKARITSGQVHHRVPIEVCKKLGIPGHIARLPCNAEAMTEQEHQKRHAEVDRWSIDEWIMFAQAIFGSLKRLL